MSAHNICFHGDIRKLAIFIFHLSRGVIHDGFDINNY